MYALVPRHLVAAAAAAAARSAARSASQLLATVLTRGKWDGVVPVPIDALRALPDQQPVLDKYLSALSHLQRLNLSSGQTVRSSSKHL